MARDDCDKALSSVGILSHSLPLSSVPLGECQGMSYRGSLLQYPHNDMLTTVNTQPRLSEPTHTAVVMSCRHDLSAERQPGHVLALAARCAR
jgi:hypothetical protein